MLTLFRGLAGSARAASGGAARVDHSGGSGARPDPARPVPTDRPPGATARHTAARADPAELRADRRRPAPGGRRRPGCRLLDATTALNQNIPVSYGGVTRDRWTTNATPSRKPAAIGNDKLSVWTPLSSNSFARTEINPFELDPPQQ
ncbi:hypothetical protein GCM10027186_40110 [Micromonospora schwarzwaldensis]